MSCQVKLKEYAPAASPMLLWIKSIENSFSKATFVSYYRLEPSLLYRNIDQLSEMFLTRPEVHLKIINHETPAEPLLISSSSFTITGKAVAILVEHPLGSVRMEGVLLNEHSPDGAVLDLSLMEMSHYQQFQKYRKKYRTLEKLTQKIDFEIDHRVRVVAAGREFRFPLDQHQASQHHFLAHASSLSVYLEEIVSVGKEMLVEVIEEQTLDLSRVYESVSTFTYSLSFIHSFQLIFLLDVVKNTNLAEKKIVCMRMLECSEANCAVRIGTERNIHIAETSLQPVLERYYDKEYGYLSLNLKEVDDSATIYDHLDKLTPSFPKYANLINQTLLSLQGANYLMFKLNEGTVKIPLVYIMEGFNVFYGGGGWVKFYIESSKQARMEVTSGRDSRRLYHLSINEIWNLSCMLGPLSECNAEELQLRVTCESTLYSIPFRRGSTKGSVKEQKLLEGKNQVSVREGSSLAILTRNSQGSSLDMLSTTALHNCFVIQVTSSAAISFQVTAHSKIYLEGGLEKPDVCPNQPTFHLLSSTHGLTKVMVELLFVPLQQPNDSQNTFYQLRHLLSFPDQSLEQSAYDIQIKRSQGKKRTLKSQLAVGSRLSQFNEGGIFVKGVEAELELTIRRMHFNEQTNYFDNQLLLQKRILINPFQMKLQKDTIPLRIAKECYEGIQMQFYDSGARVKYYLEIYAKKSPFFDYKDSSYIVRIPTFLWEVSGYSEDLQVCTHLSRRENNSSLQRIQHRQTQEVVLDHYNYNDGISVKTPLGIGYSKIMHVMKARCEVGLNIEWNNESEWYLGVISLGKGNVWLLIKRLFDPYEQKKQRSGESERTLSQGRSDRSDLHKIDPYAKTVRNLDMVRLKQQKNQLVQEGRILVTRYVQRQQKILLLNRKISEIEEKINLEAGKKEERKAKGGGGKKMKQAALEAKKFYDSICECGAKNPQFKGFCEECLGRLRKSYQAYLKEYNEKSYNYEIVMFEKYSQREKIMRLKEKVRSAKYSQSPSSDNSMGVLLRNLESGDIRNSIQMLHAELFELRDKRKSIVDTSNWQLENIQGKIRIEDEQIYQASQELAGLKVKLLEMRDSFKKAT